jgi:hypothetical protein
VSALWTVVGLALAQAPAVAPEAADPGSPDAGAQPGRMDELERRLDVLSAALENQGAGAVIPSLPVSGQFGMSPAASKVYEVKSGLSLGGYGETIFSTFAPTLQNGTFAPEDAVTDTLRAVLYVGYKFNDWLVLNSEFEWEHSGFSDDHPQGEAIVEFVYLDFLLSPAFNIRAGQILLPVGFINELHEPPIFLGALRPAVEQESGLIPTTWHENGVGFHGDLPGGLSYKAYLIDGLDSQGFNADGSGSIGGGRQDGHQAIANQPAFTGRLDWKAVPGTLLGGSFYTGNSAQAHGSTPAWTTLVEVHGEYRGHGLQVRGLYAHLNVSNAGIEAMGPSSPAFLTGTTQSGGYLEVGYDALTALRQSKQSIIPFVRFEHLDTQQGVVPGAVPNPANNQSFIELGANYKPIPQVALKGDYDFILNQASTGRNQFNLALAYLF